MYLLVMRFCLIIHLYYRFYCCCYWSLLQFYVIKYCFMYKKKGQKYYVTANNSSNLGYIPKEKFFVGRKLHTYIISNFISNIIYKAIKLQFNIIFLKRYPILQESWILYFLFLVFLVLLF